MHVRRTLSGSAALLLAAAAVITVSSRSSQAANDQNPTQDEKLKIQIGQQTAPVNLTLNKKDADTVYLGSYIVNVVAGCSDCHTFPEYLTDPFQGQPALVNAAKYLGGGRGFGPGVTSRNITPDASGKPAGMTYAEFVQAMRNGTDFDHVHTLLQVMPWPRFKYLTERDLQAIYQYLSSIPCLEGDPGVPVDPMAPPRCGP